MEEGRTERKREEGKRMQGVKIARFEVGAVYRSSVSLRKHYLGVVYAFQNE